MKYKTLRKKLELFLNEVVDKNDVYYDLAVYAMGMDELKTVINAMKRLERARERGLVPKPKR